jgi:MFS family permease
MNRNVWLLALCQGLFLINNVALIAVNGLVGLQLAPASWMATLPVMGYVVGGALATGLVARSQRAWGRKRSFQLGLLVGIVAMGLCAVAASMRQFAALVAATAVAGYYNANASLYRFAAPEIAGPQYKEKAISWVLAGGILGAVVGPNLAARTRGWFEVPFVGAYVALALVAVLALVVLSFIEFAPLPKPDPARPGRSLGEIARQPVFIVAVGAASLGYGVMSLLMSATPIAMDLCKHPFESTALVLEWHVLGMFVPSFFTGHLIKRFGALKVMSAGVLLNLGCVAVALSGVDLMQFLVALLLLGVGWNFLFVGGTTLFTDAYRPEEKTTAQAAMDFWVYVTMAITAFASGALVSTQGWEWLNWGSLLPIGLIALALGWLAAQRRRNPAAAVAP